MEGKSGTKVLRGRNSKKSRQAVDVQSIYDYTLRCAIHASREQSGSLAAATKDAKKDRSDRHSLHMGMSGVSGVIGNLTDKFGDDGSKSDKLTKEIVRGLQGRLDDVRKGKNLPVQGYDDQCFLTIIAQFQVTTLKDKRYRPTGTVNDLVIDFLKACEAELRKNSRNTPWGSQLNKYMGRFAQLVLETIQEVAPSAATPELLEMLNNFIDPSQRTRRKAENNHNATAPSTPLPQDGSLEALEKSPLVKTVQQLFQVEDAVHHRKLKELMPVCTDAAMVHDLKTCINNINLKTHPFPGRREDFTTQEAYDIWQKREIKQLRELMTLMIMSKNIGLNTSGENDGNATNLLANPANKRHSLYAEQDGHASSTTSAFTYIPSDPRFYFQHLMKMCIDYDYINDGLPDQERAKMSVLSQQTDELLRECWKTWRLSSAYRAVIYLEIVKAKFDEQKLPLEDVMDAARALDKVIKENDPAHWAINDREKLIQTYEGLNYTLLSSITTALSKYWSEKSAPWVYDLLNVLDKIYENPAYLEVHSDPLSGFLRLEETIEGAAVNRWRSLERATIKPDQDALTNLLALADRLIKEIVSIAKRKYKTPLKGILDVPGIVMAKHMPFFALEIENWAYSVEAREAPIEATFEFYHKVLSLKRLYDEYGPKKKAALFKVESWFLLHVRRWLKTTDLATPDWVANAINQDEFKPISDTAGHSSSVVDLFSMFHQAVDFVQNLEWPNEIQRCRFLTQLSKTIANALEQYTNYLEDMVRYEIEPRKEDGEDQSGGFLDRAHNFIGGRHVPKDEEMPMDFTTELCIMINDIEAARGRLDKLYQLVDVDEIADYMRDHSTPAVEKTEQTNFLYSIRIVRAENLQALDNNGLSDPFVVLEINDREVGRTATKYETLNPRWNQSFDIWVNERNVDVLAVVYDEDFIGSNQRCGSVWFPLSPEHFGDYQTHDLTLPLNPQGSLSLRISMVGEKDDIQFWFVKAFRALKRAENEAAILIVERMGKYMRQWLSKKTMDKLLRRERSFFSSFSRSRQPAEISLREQECEDAIAPLLDYLETNLKILNDNLTETNMQHVVIKIWRQVLTTLETVLRPPDNQNTEAKHLDDYEEHILFKWLELLKIFFNGGEDGDAVPLDKLENPQYMSLLKGARHHRELSSQE